MKKNVIMVIVGIVIAVAAFSAGFYSNDKTTVEYKNTKTVTKTITETKPDPIEHCMYTAIKKFPTPEGEKIKECVSLTEKDQDFAEKMLVDFIEDAVFYMN